MTGCAEEETPRYVVVESDRFADDRDRAVLRYNGRLETEYADTWYKRLTQALEDLTGFPGLLSHARDEDATNHYGREVRRLLYYGPTRKRSGSSHASYLRSCRPTLLPRRKARKRSFSCCVCFTAHRRCRPRTPTLPNEPGSGGSGHAFQGMKRGGRARGSVVALVRDAVSPVGFREIQGAVCAGHEVVRPAHL